MVADGTTLCFVSIRSQKEKKNLREICKYLNENRVERTRFLRRVGDVLEIDVEALEQRMERKADQKSQKGSEIGYCRCGAAYPSRVKCGGDCKDRRQKQRANRDCSRDDCIVLGALARALNPLQGG